RRLSVQRESHLWRCCWAQFTERLAELLLLLVLLLEHQPGLRANHLRGASGSTPAAASKSANIVIIVAPTRRLTTADAAAAQSAAEELAPSGQRLAGPDPHAAGDPHGQLHELAQHEHAVLGLQLAQLSVSGCSRRLRTASTSFGSEPSLSQLGLVEMAGDHHAGWQGVQDREDPDADHQLLQLVLAQACCLMTDRILNRATKPVSRKMLPSSRLVLPTEQIPETGSPSTSENVSTKMNLAIAMASLPHLSPAARNQATHRTTHHTQLAMPNRKVTRVIAELTRHTTDQTPVQAAANCRLPPSSEPPPKNGVTKLSLLLLDLVWFTSMQRMSGLPNSVGRELVEARGNTLSLLAVLSHGLHWARYSLARHSRKRLSVLAAADLNQRPKLMNLHGMSGLRRAWKLKVQNTAMSATSHLNPRFVLRLVAELVRHGCVVIADVDAHRNAELADGLAALRTGQVGCWKGAAHTGPFAVPGHGGDGGCMQGHEQHDDAGPEGGPQQHGDFLIPQSGSSCGVQLKSSSLQLPHPGFALSNPVSFNVNSNKQPVQVARYIGVTSQNPMALLQLQPPSAFSISADPHTVSKRWTEWATTLKRFLAASGISDDAQKQEILLYTAGKEVADIFKEISQTRPATDQPEQQTLDSLIAALTQHFQGRDNVVFTRYQFRQCTQLDGEGIDSWYNRLCNAAEACQFGELRQSLIRDQIVACCRSESLRKRLLNVPNISLPDALQLARTNEAASQQAAIMERSAAGPAEEVHAARDKRPTRRPPASPADKCLRCGEPGHRTCNRAQGKRCSNCGKLHHLAKACLSGRARINMAEPEPEEPAVAHLAEAVFSSLDPSRTSATFKAVINGANVPVLIDSGASCNVLSQRTLHLTGAPERALQPTHTRVYPLGAARPLTPAGQITLHTKINGNSERVRFIVIREDCITILGRETSTQMGMLRVGPQAETALTAGLTPTVNDLHLPQDLRLSSIMKEFSDRFQGIGCIKGVSVSIQLKEEAVPVCHPPSRVPVHLRTAVEKELKGQLAAGILERVTGPSAWSSRMVVVPKASPGEIRITQDLRDVNKYVIPEKQPIPTFEEVTDEMAGSTYFSELDVAKAFHQIEVSEESRQLLTFSTPLGLLRLKRLCMGFTSASEILQRVMTSILSGLRGVRWVHDDIIIFASTIKEHNERLRNCLDRLRQHNPGADNPADVLSRQPRPTPPNNQGEDLDTAYIAMTAQAAAPNSISLETIKVAAAGDKAIQAAVSGLRSRRWQLDSHDTRSLHGLRHELSQHDGLLLKGHQIVVPAILRYRCLQLAHQGHLGVQKTLARLQTKVWWPSMRASVENFVNSCLSCKACTNTAELKAAPLQPTELPQGPWLELGLDFLGPIRGHMLLVCTDYFSRFPLVQTMSGSTAAAPVIRTLRQWFSTFGQPVKITTDNGPPFSSAEFNAFLRSQGVHHHRTTPLHPQANGLVERCNRGLNKAIRAAILEGSDWQAALDDYLAAYRRTPHAATGMAPADLLFGRQLNDTIPSLRHSRPVDARRQTVRGHDSRAKERMKAFADSKRGATDHQITVGDLVLRRLTNRSKTDPFFEASPWTVTEVRGNTLQLQRAGQRCSRHASHVKRVSQAADEWPGDPGERDSGQDSRPDEPTGPPEPTGNQDPSSPSDFVLGNQVELKWIPDHTGFLSNEYAALKPQLLGPGPHPRLGNQLPGQRLGLIPSISSETGDNAADPEIIFNERGNKDIRKVCYKLDRTMENDSPSQEFIALQIDLNEAKKKFDSSAKQFHAQVKSETNFLRDSTRVILGSEGVSSQDKDRAVEALESFVDEIWGSFEQVMTPHVRRIVLSPAELITDHAEDPDWISSQDIKYYVDRLNNYPVTIREMDRLIVAMEIEINKIAECEARMRQLEAEAGPAGLQLDPTAAARLRDERPLVAKTPATVQLVAKATQQQQLVAWKAAVAVSGTVSCNTVSRVATGNEGSLTAATLPDGLFWRPGKSCRYVCKNFLVGYIEDRRRMYRLVHWRRSSRDHIRGCPTIQRHDADERIAANSHPTECWGSSLVSEVLSYEYMRKCYQAELLKTEMEVQYFPYGGSITDYVMRLFDRKVAVSVTRALRFDGEPFTVDNGVRLLTKKLLGIRQADRNSLESWQRHVLHVWADGRAVTEALAEAHRQLPASVLGNAIVLLTCVRNCKEIFTNNLFQRIRKPPTRVPPSHWLSSSSSRLAERELRRHRQTAAPSVRRSFRSCRAAGKSLTSLLLSREAATAAAVLAASISAGRCVSQPQMVVAGVWPGAKPAGRQLPLPSAEGLFRVEGARPRLLLLRARLDADRSCDIPADTPPQDVCSTLKAWLRQLPRPLLPAATAEALSGAANSAREDCDGDAQQRLSALRAVAAANLGGDGGCSARALRLLCLVLHRLATAGCHGNRMDSASLATCLGPCLYGAATADSAETAARLNRGVALLIRSAPDIPDAAADADDAEAEPPCQKLHRRPRPRSLSRIREAVVRAVTRLGGQSRSRSRSRSTSVSLLRLPREPARMQPAAASSKPELTRVRSLLR
uniref:CCHC-type domain-containing protein n=1 Tax=Macrostomum lignano TaxID=282301 RepID=A0A1I8HEZ0_9PLAT